MTDLSKVYRTEMIETYAQRQFNFSVKEGEFVAVTGPSGSGKTTGQRRAQKACGRCAGAGGPVGMGPSLSGRAIGRPAAAGGDCPRVGRTAEIAAGR